MPLLFTYLILGQLSILTSTILSFRDITPPIFLPEIDNKLSLEEKASNITVKIVSGKFWGSGIIIARKDDTYRILTNDHVLNEDVINYSIKTYDGNIYPGKVIATRLDFNGKDLAILEFTSQEKKYNIAEFGQTPKPQEEVFASGFPLPKLGEKNQGWVLHKGLVWGLLEKPLKQGYQLGYTNRIEKGMSGGALLNSKGEVVAVNGIHAYPLLGKPYIYEDGTTPNEKLINEMVHHSWGIPINRISPYLIKD